MAKRTNKTKILDGVDLTKRLEESEYLGRLSELQVRLQLMQQAYLLNQRKAVLVFEGWDAAGKGGTIRRMASVMDPRGLKVWPIGAPRPYYLDRHYLLRFWERLPAKGTISVFDRSWYGRVLVERIEGFATKKEWKRAYREINEFERLITDNETRVLKFFLHISPEEQLKRFEKRLLDPHKRWKLSYEDFRNRDKWPEYETAIEDMLRKTSTKRAPWHVIPAENKKYARIKTLEIVVDKLSAGIDLDPPLMDPKIIKEAGKHMDLMPELIRETTGRSH